MTDTTTAPGPGRPSEAPMGGTGIRIATAVIGGTTALLVIAVAAIGQFGFAGAASSTTTESIPASVTSIEIDNTIGDVSVFTTPGATPSIEMRIDAFAWSRAQAPVVEIDGAELSIEVPDRGRFCIGWCGGRVTILVELGDRSLDELDLRSEVGTVAVHEGVVVRDLSIGSAVGDVQVDLVDATNIDVTSDVGTIRVWAAEATRSITATTGVGDIEIGVQPGVEYDLRASSEVGEVVDGIGSVASASRSITASSDVGGVSLFIIR
jgi:hypothetical protein